ncbi:MAG: PBP1A family penicillin-binding protein [Candidatus Marinimicrobia bacterium]|jgi:penicillin-binding protein 1A|nr:PBP1A family penicillin-binding protein [Candidatus Neomarinimicrobiota bacterium]MBT3944511.1 PBP1A family penicillin-binding protein [Candidatus Neomarinimicrobiota bacterium]MBT4111966.1 PBP1A family penicillin-binding protein [Candidatus Neomarinimicrobiota bacterium]MBT4317008.1 PBP1A family penicillin-binding protein [Candidatus Neomarinimicrobiota bacterium]MBT4706331.1 PBP1A family penicillin-binding protein [Candidatus Neomarinimicrobiota bacterium]
MIKSFLSSVRIIAYLSILVIFYVVYLSRDLPSLERLETFDPAMLSTLYDRNDEVIGEFYIQKRVFIDIEDMPEHLKHAVIASEDRRFYGHWGVDLQSVFRAVIVNVSSMSFRQGFSTLSQQLARNLYKEVGFRDSITRKLKEMITAIQIERTYTKEEILEMYLNTVHFGHGTYGAESAAKRYFNKKASELTIGESAMLVGLLPSPANYSPLRNLNKAIERRSIVLKVMYNQDYIDHQEYIENNSIIPDNISYEIPRGKAPYFAEYVRRILEKQDDELGINIYQDGLKIYTTLDYRLQKIAEDVVMKTLKKNQDEFNTQLFEDPDRFSKLGYLSIFPEDSVKMMLNGQMKLYEELRQNLLVQCAFIALNSKNGEILAMIGGRSDYLDQYNRSTQALRQPGSVFKPYIYTAAIDNNYPVTTQLLNQPVALYRNNAKGEKEKWTPRNYDNSTGGLTTLREGLRRSLNLISVRMVQELVPPQQVKNIARRMQINSSIRAVDAIALGTSEVRPIEIVASYATFANKGIYSSPIAITRIEDKYGQIIKEFTNTQKEVLSPETAYMVTNLLQTVMDKGTGGSVRWKYKFRHVAGGKTGTTQNWSDAWFVGFTPSITAGAWFGVDQYPISLGKGQAGSVAALPAWALFMKEAHKTLNIPSEPFVMPEGVVEVEIDSDTKQLPTSRTKKTEIEIFLKSNQPRFN